MQDGWFNTGDYSLDPMISLLEELGRVRLERKHFDRNKEMREELSKKLGEILKKARTFSDPPNPDKSKIKQKRDRENTL